MQSHENPPSVIKIKRKAKFSSHDKLPYSLIEIMSTTTLTETRRGTSEIITTMEKDTKATLRPFELKCSRLHACLLGTFF